MTRASLLLWLQGPVRSYVVSQAYGLWTLVVFGVTFGFSRGEIVDFASLVRFLDDPKTLFSIFMALVFGIGPYARARQGYKASLVPVANPTSVSLPTNPPPTGG